MARWLRVSSADDEDATKFFSSITLHQVSLVISIYMVGLCISIIILIIEIILHNKTKKLK